MSDIDDEPEWRLTYSCDGYCKRYKLYRNDVYTDIVIKQASWGGYELTIKDVMSNSVLMSSNDLATCMQSGYDFYLKLQHLDDMIESCEEAFEKGHYRDGEEVFKELGIE